MTRELRPSVSGQSARLDDRPRRVIGALPALAIAAGSMVGIGIFLSPSIVAAHVPGTAWFFLIWILGGLTALAGAVACAELGAMIPEAGGDYVFQHEAFGASVAFASGWVLFAAIFSGSVATLAVGLCTYQLATLTGSDMSRVVLELPWLGELTLARVVACLVIVVLTGVNTLGARLSSRVQLVLTSIPILVLAVAALYAIGAGGDASVGETGPERGGLPTLHGVTRAYMAVYFAYSGWINTIYVAGEVKNPDRNIPFALIGGTLGVTLLYLLLCIGFVSVLGMAGVRSRGEVGTAVGMTLGGDTAALMVSGLIAIALLACLNGTILAGARVGYAMGRRGAIWAALGRLSGRGNVPALALGFQALIAIGLVLTGGFEQLYAMVSLAMVVTGTLTVGSLFVLRHTRPDLRRPYLATGYPVLPWVYVGSSLFVIAVMVFEALSGAPGSWYPLLGLAILAFTFSAHRLGSKKV